MQSYQLLQPNVSDPTNAILLHVSAQLSSFQLSSNITSTIPALSSIPQSSFQAPLYAIWLNILWFTSLVFSVITASVGILVKQQLRKIRADDPRSNAPVRHQVWIDGPTLFRIAGVLPLLMQLSLHSLPCLHALLAHALVVCQLGPPP